MGVGGCKSSVEEWGDRKYIDEHSERDIKASVGEEIKLHVGGEERQSNR